MKQIYEYDVALSFAGENREYVEQTAIILKGNGVKVFYDKFEEANLWGKDLFSHLNEIYKERARFTIMFISEDYQKKLWTTHERKSMQERAFKESQEYILPARFDDTEIPGLFETVGYIDLNTKSPSEFSDLVLEKLGWSQPNRWWGKWKLESNRPLYDGLLFISSVDQKGFTFELDNVNGAHSGYVDGEAIFTSKNEAVFETEIEDSEENEVCKINFVRTNDVVQITEGFECNYFHGMQSYFDGEYSISKDVFYDLLFTNETLTEIYKCLKSIDNWGKLLTCFSAIYADDYDYTKRIRTIQGSAAGLFGTYEGLLILEEATNIIWGALVYEENRYYFSNSKDSSIPNAIIEWKEEFNSPVDNIDA